MVRLCTAVNDTYCNTAPNGKLTNKQGNKHNPGISGCISDLFFFWGGEICVKTNQTNAGMRNDSPSSKWRAFHRNLLLGFSDCHHQLWSSVFLRHAQWAVSSLRLLALYLSSFRACAAALQHFFHDGVCAGSVQGEEGEKDKTNKPTPRVLKQSPEHWNK